MMGFMKAFNLMKLNDFKMEISKSLGIIWLLTAFLFLIVAILYLWNIDWWWILGGAAVIISQLLIILSWQDAKVGTIANVIILVVLIIGSAAWNMNNQVKSEIQEMYQQQKSTEREVVSEAMLKDLPIPVQTWLQQIGVVGTEKIQTVSFKQKGQMKLKPDQEKWSSAEAEQYITVNDPGFVWKVNMKMMPIIPVSGIDVFKNGTGEMTMKIASVIPVVKVAENEKVNQSSLQRYLLELPWYPTAALHPSITWESIDETTAKATMEYGGTTGTATYFFDITGDLLKVSAMRYKDHDETAQLIECIGEVKNYGRVNGIKIPIEMDVSWVLDEGVFTWYKLEIYDVTFN
ncbi:hypothetical protein D8M06_17105 [Oceanobacillus halophilus]|uniref:Uncharacterized protein n=2 Tax=Oceanobacillus halophilus TaxID=930130 RepID=A0A494ZTX8_9BACI|nr:hypothetical protein D8M06_17105 [Oceanobacillus halophilus]